MNIIKENESFNFRSLFENQIGKGLQEIFKFQITDNSNTVIFNNLIEEQSELMAVPIKCGEMIFGHLSSSKNQIDDIKTIIEFEISFNLKNSALMGQKLESQSKLIQNLSILNNMGTSKNTEAQFNQFFNFIRTFFSFKDIYFFRRHSEKNYFEIFPSNLYKHLNESPDQLAALENIVSLCFEKKTYIFSPDFPLVPSLKKNSGYNIGTQAFLALPIIFSGQMNGCLILCGRIGSEFDESDLVELEFYRSVLSAMINEYNTLEVIDEKQSIEKKGLRYLSENARKAIGKSAGNSSSKREKIIVSFVEIKNFNAISRGIPSDKLIFLINHFYHTISEVINAHGGSIDKIIPPNIMATWDLSQQDNSLFESAINSLLETRKAVTEMVAPLWKKYSSLPFTISAGLNFGDAVIGNLGCHQFYDFTSIGDTVNTTQRLCSHAKDGQIWIGHNFVESIPTEIEIIKQMQKIENVKLKGKVAPQTIYQL